MHIYVCMYNNSQRKINNLIESRAWEFLEKAAGSGWREGRKGESGVILLQAKAP